MRIVDKSASLKNLNDIDAGTVFRWDGKLMIKTDCTSGSGPAAECVDLASGIVYNLLDDDAVRVVNATLTVEN